MSHITCFAIDPPFSFLVTYRVIVYNLNSFSNRKALLFTIFTQLKLFSIHISCDLELFHASVLYEFLTIASILITYLKGHYCR